jgi:hypothetical protein
MARWRLPSEGRIKIDSIDGAEDAITAVDDAIHFVPPTRKPRAIRTDSHKINNLNTSAENCRPPNAASATWIWPRHWWNSPRATFFAGVPVQRRQAIAQPQGVLHLLHNFCFGFVLSARKK